MNGLVRYYDNRKAYGFIEGLTGHSGSNPMIFFHLSACRTQTAPPVGSEVRFNLVRGEKGPQAANIQLVHISTRALSKVAPEPEPPIPPQIPR